MHGPPLNALRAFEASARTGSFTAAARDLKVTSAAVSQQVRSLEIYWKRTLFVRQGNRLSLTEAGLTAYPPLEKALGAVQELSGMMLGTPRQARFVLSAPHSVVETWLPARLANWLLETGDNMVDVRIDDDPIDFARDRVHMRIFYGHSLYSEYRTEALFQDKYFAVASPGFAGTHGTKLELLPDRLMIQTDWGAGYASGPEWSQVMPGGRMVDSRAGLRVPSSSAAIACALEGIGAALVPASMVRHHLATGRLDCLKASPTPMARPYSVAFPHTIAERPIVRKLLRALTIES